MERTQLNNASAVDPHRTVHLLNIKTRLITVLCLCGLASGAFGQEFQNLDFEWAWVTPPGPGQVPISEGLPGWTGYCGANVLESVNYNLEYLDTVGISILDTNCSYYCWYPQLSGFIHGRYCALIQSGLGPGGHGPPTDASIAQTGTIPANAISIIFNIDEFGSVGVTFNGTPIPLATLSVQSTYWVLRGDVRQFAGQTGELRFTKPVVWSSYPPDPTLYPSWGPVLLDDIQFSSTLGREEFSYTITNGTITITGYHGPGGAMVIPDTINGLPVTSIGDDAFRNCGMTSVTIPNGVTSIGDWAFYGCTSFCSVTIPNSVTSIGEGAFGDCGSLTGVTIPDSVTSIGDWAFCGCTSLTNATIGSSVTSIGSSAFSSCTSLANLTIGNSVTNLGSSAFQSCISLTSVTIPTSVTNIGDRAFACCGSVTGVYFQGNAPSLGGSSVFAGDNNATVYYLPGTTGWGTTFGGRPTALWVQVPTLLASPQTQTAEEGSNVELWAQATNALPLFYLWYLNATNFISGSTNCGLELTNVDFSQIGTYTAVISNALGAVTSAPAQLSVIQPVERRWVPGLTLRGQPGDTVNLDATSTLAPTPNWATLDSVLLTNTSQWYFDLTTPLPPYRFYRTWQSNTLGPASRLDLHLIPAITLTGNPGSRIRLDGINQFGPIDAWFTVDTVTLTSPSQLYFDVSVIGQPNRLYRLVPMP